MTVTLPEPIPLEMPPGEPAAIEDLVRAVAGAAFRLAGIGELLTGRGTPGWLGDDATAAEAQLARLTSIVRESAAAVLAATGRLSAHGERLRDTRREVGALREEQAEDFRVARLRLLRTADPQLAVMTGAAGWAGVVADVEAAEARRRRRHALLLEDLADDAAATVRALADAGRPVGGTGRPGDGGRVLAHLAVALPGWGHPELVQRAHALGRALADAELPAAERAVPAREAAAYAGAPAFATAFVRSLGADGVGRLLEHVGTTLDGQVAAVLAAALGAAVPGRTRTDGVRRVLEAEYLARGDVASADRRATGMALVLAAGAGSAGLRTPTVGEWTRQLLVREDASGRPAGLDPGTLGRRPGEPRDATAAGVAALARVATPGEAAAFLGGPRTWELLLAHAHGDDGAALSDLVATAAADTGPAGDAAVRIGLETIGAGLVEGDPVDRTVGRVTVGEVASALGDAVAAHVQVAAEALAAAASGGCPPRTGHLLRGLASVSVDAGAAAGVEAAIRGWAVAHAGDAGGSPHPAIAAPSAYVAVQEFGHRLFHALEGFDLRLAAERREQLWNWTAGLSLEVASFGPGKATAPGVVAEAVGAFAPALLGADGTWEQGPYRGPAYDARDGLAAVGRSGDPELGRRIHELAGEAELSFTRTAQLLGEPAPPVAPDADHGGAILDLVTDGLGGWGKDDRESTPRKPGSRRGGP